MADLGIVVDEIVDDVLVADVQIVVGVLVAVVQIDVDGGVVGDVIGQRVVVELGRKVLARMRLAKRRHCEPTLLILVMLVTARKFVR